MITTRNLTKRFGNVEAVREVGLDVREGDRYGLLGPNGSGKSTLVRMLLGLVYATSGEISVLGHRVPNQASRVLPEIGALIEDPAAYPHLSGRANLRLLDAAGPRGERRTRRRRVDDALEQVGLSGIDRRPVRAYSLGMRQRLGLAAALVRRPRLLILDEPTNGLDPQGTREVRALIREIAADGTTVFVSSHLLAEVEQICSHVGVMRAGELVFQGTLEQMRGRGAARILVRTAEPELAAQVLGRLGLADVAVDGREVTAQLGSQAPETVCAELVHAGVPVAGLDTPRASLEDLFVELTGEGFDVNG